MASLSGTKALLQQYYNDIRMDVFPEQREKCEWTRENNYSFLLGLLAHGREPDTAELHRLLTTLRFGEYEQAFIDSMFARYIRPFQMGYHTSPRRFYRPSVIHPRDLRSNSPIDHADLGYGEIERTVVMRDGGCLFCWEGDLCTNVRIIVPSHMAPELLQEVGLTEMDQIQNGLLLCLRCQRGFASLTEYIDIVNGQLVVKFARRNKDEERVRPKRFKMIRDCEQRIRHVPERRSVEPNGELALYFEDKNQELQPNRKALELHRKACLMWQMAGGAEEDYDYCSDCDDSPGTPR